MLETDSGYLITEMSGPHKTESSSATMSGFRGSVGDQLPSFLYRLRDENPLATSGRGDQPSFFNLRESKQNATVAKGRIPPSPIVLHDMVSQSKAFIYNRISNPDFVGLMLVASSNH